MRIHDDWRAVTGGGYAGMPITVGRPTMTDCLPQTVRSSGPVRHKQGRKLIRTKWTQ